jgi:hypothetical protein
LEYVEVIEDKSRQRPVVDQGTRRTKLDKENENNQEDTAMRLSEMRGTKRSSATCRFPQRMEVASRLVIVVLGVADSDHEDHPRLFR